ncbi:Scr1 family TA system antitoxin-like transcriptional regulator [Streptomyces sp. NBC_00829]|uniref:helix-turn-helix domain-containing protein n=1 Tax=Streptomyces sp. NBC_00829 TaxID=2903679 RepID=UPI00386DAEF8|nr:helix-turn-helix transcriptional regulator [Streptomyces sp. NBC_00829]
MSRPKDLNPWHSPRAFYGSELRRLREAADLTQEALGAQVFCSGSYIGQIEAAKRWPPLDLAQRLDAVLKSDGFLARMCDAVNESSGHAEYFRLAAELERMAKSISHWAPMLVPGLLQTASYTRALTRAGRPFATEDEVERKVSSRQERARLLDQPARPELWCVLHEATLRIPVGSAAEMREQLAHIVELCDAGRAVVQVMPFPAGPLPLMHESAKLMAFVDAPPVVYLEGAYSGQLLDDPALVDSYLKAYDLARAAALSPEASLTMIRSAMEDYSS